MGWMIERRGKRGFGGLGAGDGGGVRIKWVFGVGVGI